MVAQERAVQNLDGGLRVLAIDLDERIALADLDAVHRLSRHPTRVREDGLERSDAGTGLATHRDVQLNRVGRLFISLSAVGLGDRACGSGALSGARSRSRSRRGRR